MQICQHHFIPNHSIRFIFRYDTGPSKKLNETIIKSIWNSTVDTDTGGYSFYIMTMKLGTLLLPTVTYIVMFNLTGLHTKNFK